MRIHRIATTAAAGLTAAAIVTLGAGAATAATAEPCPGTGPAASLPAAQHDAFLKEMTALKAKRDAIMKKYGKAAPARRGQGAGQPGRGGGRGAGAALSTKQRTAMQAELATWRVSRDALFAKYGITPRNQGRSA
ncbi:MAG TPA: hypothetical protein VF143_10470 [Candidatus Nanopelagicales bacterium]